MKTSVLEFIFKNTVEDREQKKISAIEGGNSEWILGFNINDPEQKQKKINLLDPHQQSTK